MEARPSRGLKRAVQIAVSAGILAAFAWTTDWTQAGEMLVRADPWVLLVMALLYPLDRLFMAWKWHLLARVHASSVNLWTGTRIYLASSAVGLFLPLGGLGPDLVRTAMLSNHGMKPEAAVSSILVERLCGMIGAALMLIVALVLLLVLLPEQGSQLQMLLPAMLGAFVAMPGILVVAAWLLGKSAVVRSGWQRLQRRPVVVRYAGPVWTYSAHRQLLLTNVVLSWLEQLAPIFAFYLAFRGFGVPLGFLECAAMVPLASILERLPISVGGIGVRELGIVVIAGLFGVTRTDAFLVSLFEHLVFMLTMIPLGLLYFASRDEVRRSPALPRALQGESPRRVAEDPARL